MFQQGRFLRRVLSLMVVFAPCGLVGCVPLPYVYPTVSYVPPVEVEAPAADVHAFRVTTRESVAVNFLNWKDEQEFEPLQVDERGRVVGQTDLSLARGCYWWLPVTPFQWRSSRDCSVRLYRPGYQVIYRNPWEWDQKIEWKPASSLTSQEKALEDLLRICEKPGDPLGCGPCLAPGAISAKHKECLLFLASEYERLAGLSLAGAADDSQKRGDRLMARVKQLRDLAGKPAGEVR